MWNTMECKRDSFSGALGGARETHWEYVSHRLNELREQDKNPESDKFVDSIVSVYQKIKKWIFEINRKFLR